MDAETQQLLALQGEIRIALMRIGLPMDVAGDAAAEAVDVLCRSPVATEAHRNAYAAF